MANGKENAIKSLEDLSDKSNDKKQPLGLSVLEESITLAGMINLCEIMPSHVVEMKYSTENNFVNATSRAGLAQLEILE